MYLVQIIVFSIGLFTKKFLGPSNLGIWNILVILISYFSYFDLGISDAAGREIPYWRSKKEENRASRYINIMYTYNVGTGIILGAGIILYSTVFRNDFSHEYFIGLTVVGFLFPLSRWIVCGTMYYRSTKQFVFLSKSNIIVMLFNGVTSLLLVWKFDLYGLYAGFSLQTAFNLLYWKSSNKWGKFFTIYFSKEDFLYLFKIGFPIALGGFIFTVFRTLDGVITNKYLGAASFGIYSLGTSMTSFIFNLPNSFSIIMYPRFQERFGSSNDEQQSLISFIVKPTLVLVFLILPLIIGTAFFGGPFLIRSILPKFTDGIIPFKILLTGIFFFSLIHMPGQFLVTINKQVKSAIITIIALILLFSSVYLAIHLGYGLRGIAIATSLSYIFYCFTLFFYVFLLLKRRDILLSVYVQIISIFIFCFSLLLVLDTIIVTTNSDIMHDLFFTFVKMIIYVLFCIPLFIYANKKTNIINDIFSIINKKVFKKEE